MILQVRLVPPGLAGGRRLEHRGSPLDQRLADLPACRFVQLVIAPIVNQSQPEKLMSRGQVHAVDPTQAPGLVAAGGQGPLPGTVEVPLFATDGVGHRQHGHGVAHLALPKLLVAAVSVVEDVRWRPTADRLVGLRAELLPHTRVRGLDRFAEFCNPLTRQVDPGVDALHFFQGQGNGL